MKNKKTDNQQMWMIGSWVCYALGWLVLDLFMIVGAIFGYIYWKNGGSKAPMLTNAITFAVIFILFFIAGFVIAVI